MPHFQNAHRAVSDSRPYAIAAAGASAWCITFRDGSEIHYTGTRIEASCFARCYDRLFLSPAAPVAAGFLSESEKLEMAEGVAAEMAEVEQDHLDARLYA
jgi:hypothetical protein